MRKALLIKRKSRRGLVKITASLLIIAGVSGFTLSNQTEAQENADFISSCLEAVDLNLDKPDHKLNQEADFFNPDKGPKIFSLESSSPSRVDQQATNQKLERKQKLYMQELLSTRDSSTEPGTGTGDCLAASLWVPEEPRTDSVSEIFNQEVLTAETRDTNGASPKPTASFLEEEVRGVSDLLPVEMQLLPIEPGASYSPSNPMPKEMLSTLENPLVYPVSTDANAPELPELDPGKSLVVENGQQIDVNSSINESVESYVVKGSSWSVNLRAIDSAGSAIKLNFFGQIILTSNRLMEVRGEGYAPGSKVRIWLFSKPVQLGKVTVDSSGSFTARGVIPEDLIQGTHTVQVNGFSQSGQIRSVSHGVVVDTNRILATEVQTEDLTWWLVLLVIAGGYFFLYVLREQSRQEQASETVPISELFPEAFLR